MNTYRLTVEVDIDSMHLFSAVIKVEDAVKKVEGVRFVHADWDRDDPCNVADFEGARRLLAPADEA